MAGALIHSFTMIRSQARIPSPLLLLAVLYGAASFAHFWHNAEYLADYPNLPAWLLRWQVYATWLGIAAVGALGLVLLRAGHRAIGLVLLAVYAVVGFDGLAHYARAPMASHTFAMNFTIWAEVVAAALLLSFVLWRMLLTFRRVAH